MQGDGYAGCDGSAYSAATLALNLARPKITAIRNIRNIRQLSQIYSNIQPIASRL